MIAIFENGGNITLQGIEEFLREGGKFQLDDESYWITGEVNPGLVYYQLGSWAWAYLVYEMNGNYDIILKYFIEDVPIMGKEASFQLHFGRTIDEFMVEFDAFIRGTNEDVTAILD